MAFIRKVYLFFAATLLFCVGGAALGINNPKIMQAAMGINPLLFLVALFAVIFGLHAVSKIPVLNVVALFSVGTVLGMAVSPLLYFAMKTDATIIPNAFIMTSAIFGGLTTYALVSRRDFSWMGAGLMIGIFVLIGCVVAFMFFTPSKTMYMAYLILGVIIFSGFILYDTSMILHHFAEDEYIMAAFHLFYDFFALFIKLVQILMISRD